MTELQKSQIYGQLLNEHTRIGNKISEIKGQNIDLTPEHRKQISELENIQIQIMLRIKKLMS